MSYELTIDNEDVFSVLGGVNITGNHIVTYYNYGSNDLLPSLRATKRTEIDTKPVYGLSIFSRQIDINGERLPSDDSSVPDYKTYKAISFSVSEVSKDLGLKLLMISAKNAVLRAYIDKLVQLRQSDDVPINIVDQINSKIASSKNAISANTISCKLKSIGGYTLLADGFIAGSSVQYDFTPLYNSGTMQGTLLYE